MKTPTIASMVVVMPCGFAVAPGKAIPTTMPAKMLQGTGAFEDDLLKDLIPYIESHYRFVQGQIYERLPD